MAACAHGVEKALFRPCEAGCRRAGEFEVWQTRLTNPNFAEYAQSCGGLGIRVLNEEDLDQAVATAMAHQGPSLVEIITDVALI